MDANEMCDTNIFELNKQVISDTHETEEEQESLSSHEETDSDDIPSSLLSYFETSKSRAAVCEKLILEELEDFTASRHTEDMMNLSFELDKDTMKPNEQVISETENEENNTSSDTRLLPAPTEALFTHNVSVCSNNEDEYMESEKRLALEYEAERERQRCEELKNEEQKRQIERDFQEELKKIMEAEKLHQKELELMGKRAQEKLEQELLLQQEVISNLQRRVEEERRMREEEQKRMKDEEDKRRRRKKEEERRMREEEQKRMKDEEDKRRREEVERKRMEEERRMREEEQKRMKDEEDKRKREEVERKRMEEESKRKKEEERKIEEMKLKKEEERKCEEEEKRRQEREEMRKREKERKKLEEEMRIMKEEEERKRKEEEERRKREEERKNIKEARKKMEEEMNQKEKEIRREEENMRIEEEMRITKEVEERKKQEETRRKKEEEEALHEEMRKRDEREHGNVDKERREEEEKGRKTMKEKKEVKEVVRNKEGENRKMKEHPRPVEEDEKRKKEDKRRSQKEEMRQEDEESYRKSLKEDKEGYKRYDEDNRKMEHESEAKDEEKKQEEEDKRLAMEEMRKHEEAEKELKEEEVGGNKKNTEEIRLKEKEESKKRVMHDREEEGRRTHELQEKDGPTWTSSSPGPSHRESTTSPTSTETSPQPVESISQTSSERPSSLSVILPVSLPEHTENKRLAWMKDCVPWSKLSLQNRRKQKGSVRSRRGLRGAAEAGGLPPLCPDALLQSMGWKSLQEVTTVTLEDLPGCSLSTLTQCTRLRSLTLRRCGLRSLEGVNQLPQLCYIDVQENDISFIDCENMTSLRVLLLGHNKLTSIHGLTGAENLDVLDLSHNSITRIAGLESVRRLQRLSVDHNQLISTKGLRDVYTLLHLSCSHNHLARAEGLENSAVLGTLDLRANSLTEPPSLNNQVLLRELLLDDNSISSLHGLAACWLPLMHHLSVAQNRITQLPAMSDCVSLANLDLRFNCLSELQNVCESLEGCFFLREVHLTGNPLQQESGWRSTLKKAVPGLRAIDDQETDSFLTPPAAVQQFSLASGSFLTFCQAQLQQTRDLQQQQSRELSNASSSLDAVETSCRHFTEALQLAQDQRFAHEYGDTTVAAGQTTPEERTLDMDSANAERHTERPEMDSTGKLKPVLPNGDRCSCWTFEDKSAAESRRDTFTTVTTGPKTEPTASKVNPGSINSSAAKGTTSSSDLEMTSGSNHEDLDRQNTAAVVIQQLWRKYRQKCGNISSFSTAEKGGGGRGGDGGKPESGPSYINGSVVGRDRAATVIQAFWRGFSLRRRLASALAAVTGPDIGEDDTFEEVDVDEFVFDEAALENHWKLSLSEDSPPRRYPLSEQPLSLKPPGHFPEPPQYILPPPPVWRPKQAWVPGEHVDSAGHRVSPESSNRSKSPASSSVLSGLSERSEKIMEEWGFTDSHTALLMLKRAQKMKSTTQRQKKRRDPSVRLTLFRNCSSQLAPVEARNRPAQHNRNDRKAGEAEPGLQQAEKVERVKQERARQWLHTQAAHTDPESVHFLPEISPDVLNGGRVQLVADPGYTERLHHASGLWANNGSAAQASCKEGNYPRRNSLGHARKEVPSPQRVSSAPSKKERISHRDNPVQLSGGWGGGKKRDKVYK